MNDQRITARELRIGNKLMIGKYLITVAELYTYEFKTPEEGTLSYSHPQLRGLSLTEEWLLKFGFILYDDCGDLKGNDRFWSKPGFIGQLSPETYKHSTTGCYIKYVHQLQNLYFALTGTELTIKETAS